MIEPG